MLDAIAEAVLTLVVVLLALEVLGVLPPTEGEPPATWAMVVVVLVILAFEKLLTIHHALHFVRDFIPVKSS